MPPDSSSETVYTSPRERRTVALDAYHAQPVVPSRPGRPNLSEESLSHYDEYDPLFVPIPVNVDDREVSPDSDPTPDTSPEHDPGDPIYMHTSEPVAGATQFGSQASAALLQDLEPLGAKEVLPIPMTRSDVTELRRVASAWEYARRMGDYEATLAADSTGVHLAKAYRTYKDLLDVEDDTAAQCRRNALYTALYAPDDAAREPWLRSPGPDPQTASSSASSPPRSNPILNAACTTHDLHLGPRRDPDHAGDDVTVQFVVEHTTGTHFVPTDVRSCMYAHMLVGLPGGLSRRLRMVVDSGAAWTCIRAAELKRLGIKTLHSASERFHGASGEPLQVLGWCVITLRMGTREFQTKAFVFKHLAEPMLLGANTLTDEGLVIDGANQAIYRGTPRSLPADAVPVVARQPLHAANENEQVAPATPDAILDDVPPPLPRHPHFVLCELLRCPRSSSLHPGISPRGG